MKPVWRKSSYSGSQGNCVEVADLAGSVAVRNSQHPHRGTLTFATMRAFIDACKNGEFDNLA